MSSIATYIESEFWSGSVVPRLSKLLDSGVATRIVDFDALGDVFHPMLAGTNTNGGGTLQLALTSLASLDAVQRYVAHIATEEDRSPRHDALKHYFFTRLGPFIASRALEFETLFPGLVVPVVAHFQTAGGDHPNLDVQLTRRHLLCLNGLGLFGYAPENVTANPASLCSSLHAVGSMNWFPVMKFPSDCGVQRLTALLGYFHAWMVGWEDASTTARRDELVTFSRYRPRSISLPNFAGARDVPVFLPKSNRDEDGAPFYGNDFAAHGVVLDSTRLIEDFERADAHVDFANEQIHIGRIISSCTQEEVMFSARPELYPAVILFDTIEKDEAVVIRGARIYASYEGYLKSFRVTRIAELGSSTSEPPQVVAMDAHVNVGDQFTATENRRDIVKAYTGFMGVHGGRAISTGPWGCGVFAGDTTLKFVQQAIAAAAGDCAISGNGPCAQMQPGRRYLYYHCNARQLPLFQRLVDLFVRKEINVAELYVAVDAYGSFEGGALRRGVAPPESFAEFLLQMFGDA